MTTQNDITDLIAYLRVAYPNYNPDITGRPNAVDVLFDLLGDLDTDALKTAVRACCAEPGRAFAPSAGEIRGMVTNLRMKAAGVPTAGEAWGAVMEHFTHLNYDTPELLDHPLVKETIHCMGGLGVIGGSTNSMADRAHFMRIYSELVDRKVSEDATLPSVRAYIEAQDLPALTDGKDGYDTVDDILNEMARR